MHNAAAPASIKCISRDFCDRHPMHVVAPLARDGGRENERASECNQGHKIASDSKSEELSSEIYYFCDKLSLAEAVDVNFDVRSALL